MLFKHTNLNYKVIYQEYLSGKTVRELAKSYNIHVQTIYSFFYRHNFKLNEIPIKSRKYHVNDNFFENIDNEEKAYFLGFMLADGYVVENPNGQNRIGMKLSNIDSALLITLKNLISKDYPVYEKENSIGFLISGDKLYNDLVKLNCIKNKTYSNIQLPIIKKELYRHLIRGYFDADGSIGIRSARPKQRQINICSINKNILEDIKLIFDEFSIDCNIYTERRLGKLLPHPNTGKLYDSFRDMYRLTLLSHVSKCKLFEFFYKDSTIYLERKYIKYKEYYENTVLNLENNKSKSV